MKILPKITLVWIALSAILPIQTLAQIEFIEHVITDEYDGATSVFASDIDSDGDIDLVGCASRDEEVTWWENDGDENFTEHTIEGDFESGYSVFAIDLDQDDDIDVLAAGAGSAHLGRFTWWENDGDQEFTEYTLATFYSGAISVSATDIDGDDDNDILGAAFGSHRVTWWENEGDREFADHTVDGSFRRAFSAMAADLDEDGDIDIIGAASEDDELKWWDNEGDEEFIGHVIEDDFHGASYAFPVDLDEDGDFDVLGTAIYENEIAWWENDGDNEFTKHSIDDNFNDACCVCAEDLDNDGDIDIVGAGSNIFTWWENDGNEDLTEHPIRTSDVIDMRTFARISDIDQDGDFDIITADWYNDDIVWWENRGAPLPPEPFSLVSPNEDTVWIADTTLVWHLSTDPDAEVPACFDVWAGTSEDLSNAILAADSIPDTTYNIQNLEDDTIYFWTVRATDSNTDGIWADDTLSFTTYFIEPPEAFLLASPADGFELISSTEFPLDFTWFEAIDPDPDDVLNYTLEISIDAEFADPADFNAGEDIFFEVENLDINEYWWRVKAEDRFDLEVYSSEIRTINVTLNANEPTLNGIPEEYCIKSVYPNPFNPVLTIDIGLPGEADLKVTVLNLLGKEVGVLTDRKFEPGYHQFSFDGH
ncbi:MAG: FG-GAP-like repeat-containing protein, partial [Candidatus Electryonea clarkiae]|nr:FG-GAP-like repeat-containing protein [Candidatus Electryonea clarkiae]